MKKSKSKRHPGGVLLEAVSAEALRRMEEAGPLDDEVELRRAFDMGQTRQEQVRIRNWLLARRLGLAQELLRWQQLLIWMLLALGLGMALAGLTAARGVLSADGSINAMGALVSLLLLPTLTLLLWLLGLAAARWLPSGSGQSTRGASFARLALALLARLPHRSQGHAGLLARAFISLLQRQRLWPWFSGLISHIVWLVALLLMLGALLYGFSFKAYTLSWETTILGPEFFQKLVSITGLLPALLGFPVPEAAQVAQAAQRSAEAISDQQQAWAWWLMGCVFAYGIVPRLVAGLFCMGNWRFGVADLARVDTSDPYVQNLMRRLDGLGPLPQVSDAEHSVADGRGLPLGQLPLDATPEGALAIGFEWPADLPWPPPALEGVASCRMLGESAERKQLLAELSSRPRARLALVVHAPSSPDRGTGRFLRLLAAHAGQLALCPLAARDAHVSRRWRDWLQRQQLSQVAFVEDAQTLRQWLDDGHGR